MSSRLYSPHKLEIIKSCFTSQECIPVKILYILFPCLFCLEKYLKPQCWTESLFLMCPYINQKEEQRTFHGSLGYSDLTFYQLRDLSPPWKKEELFQRECGKAKNQHYTFPYSLTYWSKRPAVCSKRKDPESFVWTRYRVTMPCSALQAAGVTRDPGKKESSALHTQEPKGICSTRGHRDIQELQPTELTRYFLINHSLMHLSHKDSGG